MMKKIIIYGLVFIMLLCTGFYFLFFHDKIIKEKNISLSETGVYLNVNETKKLVVTFNPQDTTDKTVSWTSSDEEIVSVNSDGSILALKEGSATITARSLNGKTAFCQVEVKKNIILAESIVLNKNEIELKVGESNTITAIINPDNTTDKTLVWSSSNEKVAVVNEGKITAVSVGDANVKVRTIDNYVEATVKVHVKEPVTNPVKEEKLKLSKSEIVLEPSQNEVILTNITNSNGEIKWTSSDSSIASVENGKITAHKAGSVTITCQYQGQMATVSTKVYEYFDIGLFWGQSNMVGRNGIYENEKTDNNVIYLKNVDSDIVVNTKSYARVNLSMTKKVAFEYKYSTNKLYDISDNPDTFGESLYYNNGKLSSTKDNGENIQKSSGTNMIPYFAKEYYAQTNHKLIVVFAASGGKSINKFLPSSTTNLYKIITTQFKQAEKYILGQNSYYRIRNKFYVVYQGESDANESLASNYAKTYSTVHNNLIKDLNLSFGAMVYIVRGNASYNNTYVQTVRLQQKKVVSENSNLIMGTDFPYIQLSNGNRSILCPEPNQIHLNASGLSQIGREVAKSIAKSGKLVK